MPPIIQSTSPSCHPSPIGRLPSCPKYCDSLLVGLSPATAVLSNGFFTLQLVVGWCGVGGGLLETNLTMKLRRPMLLIFHWLLLVFRIKTEFPITERCAVCSPARCALLLHTCLASLCSLHSKYSTLLLSLLPCHILVRAFVPLTPHYPPLINTYSSF